MKTNAKRGREMTFTLPQIKAAWASYKAAKGYRIQKEGKSSIRLTMPDLQKEALTKCEFINLRDHISFPDYLEKLNG